MKKIGILTLHSGLNEGALLQALALSSFLQKSIPDVSVEIIDFRYIQKIKAYGPLTDQRKVTLFNFTPQTLPLSKLRMINAHYHNLYAWIEQEYDMLVLGSDEIWKLYYKKNWLGKYTNQPSPWHPPFPNVYWPEKISIPIVAYAPSVGRTDLSTIPKNHIDEMAKRIDTFNLLSYRDKKTFEFFRLINPKLAEKAIFVPDPLFTLPLDFIDDLKERVKMRLSNIGINFKNMRLGVIADPALYLKDSLRFFKKRGYQTIGLSYPNSQVDIDLSSQPFNPLEWICALHLMNACISNRFHGCVSCLLGEVPFIGIDQFKPAGSTKIECLLESFSLSQYYYRPHLSDRKNMIELCETLINRPWPSDSIVQIRHEFKEISVKYMMKIKKLMKCEPEYEIV